jgi:sulfur carrier protein ThiS
MALVKLNGQSVNRREWAGTPVPDGAVVDVQVIAAGG